jgi:hypothetical protein
MSALKDARVSPEAAGLPPGADLFGIDLTTIIEAVKKALAPELWRWVREHDDDVIFKKKILFVTFNFHVRDAHWLVERLLGPDPYDTPVNAREH